MDREERLRRRREWDRSERSVERHKQIKEIGEMKQYERARGAVLTVEQREMINQERRN